MPTRKTKEVKEEVKIPDLETVYEFVEESTPFQKGLRLSKQELMDHGVAEETIKTMLELKVIK
jgi:SOS response regulatory protein OraA/RecX